MPGIIDCHSHIAIEGGVNEGSLSVSSIANIAEVLDSDDVDIYRESCRRCDHRKTFCTAARIPLAGRPSSSNCVGASRQRNCRSRAHFRVSSLLSAKIPSARISAFPGKPKRYPATRMGVEETIRGAFAEARDYKNSWRRTGNAISGGGKNAFAAETRPAT